ncbi:MFS transporter [Cryptosporangium aurantiacum]|uniref:Major Facilitator Superfamily protein n=1 Tax=Cryptosporangium aurantiacum TaxID=134849 RepID=A0A1M7PCR1_9ACTN|nr:MFS transporter [Cryptosporangium aurantiacum]SHN14686.1 Major Facilitator Superfamily protein [Cryptosporangium aurantiacum]
MAVPDTAGALVAEPPNGALPPGAAAGPAPERRASRQFLWLSLIASFGAQLAYVTPVVLSLAIRVEDLTPGREQNLGYLTGIGAVVALLAGPVYGQLSDRTRSRFGRRRPWILGAALAGMPALLVMAFAPNVLVLGVGWVLAMATWGQVGVLIGMSHADWLGESQRGKVSGIAGFLAALGPIVGSVLAGAVSRNDLLLFLIPGLLGLVLTIPFVLFFNDTDSRNQVTDTPLSLRALVSSYRFSFTRERDFSINWFVRFFFTAGIYLATTFTSFYVAQLLGVPVADAGSTLAISGGVGVLAMIVGALGGGWLSDRVGRRKPVLLAAAAFFLAGMILVVLADGLPLFYAGMALMNLGIGVFGSADTALMLDVLPDREGAGRYVGMTQVALQLAHAGAPLIAPVFLAIGSGADKNYDALYLAAGLFAVLGALLALPIRSAR